VANSRLEPKLHKLTQVELTKTGLRFLEDSCNNVAIVWRSSNHVLDVSYHINLDSAHKVQDSTQATNFRKQPAELILRFLLHKSERAHTIWDTEAKVVYQGSFLDSFFGVSFHCCFCHFLNRGWCFQERSLRLQGRFEIQNCFICNHKSHLSHKKRQSLGF
jgi:hypothetical protein